MNQRKYSVDTIGLRIDVTVYSVQGCDRGRGHSARQYTGISDPVDRCAQRCIQLREDRQQCPPRTHQFPNHRDDCAQPLTLLGFSLRGRVHWSLESNRGAPGSRCFTAYALHVCCFGCMSSGSLTRAGRVEDPPAPRNIRHFLVRFGSGSN